MSAPIDKTFIREYERNDEKVLKIHQSAIGDVGCVVWDAALVLCKYLESGDFGCGAKLKGKTVLELGAGTGVVGLVAGSLGAHVTITDLPEFLPLINLNIKENNELFGDDVKAETLIWGQTEYNTKDENIDYILLADCIYYEESLEPLVNTIVKLCQQHTTILCCYEQRDTGNKPQLERRFFELVRESLKVEEISLDNQDPLYSSPDIHIMKFTKQPG
ncbi:hypothetical protein SNE40_021892 [Patella caerulea]|uniref:Uncharacterized protein n=1 Tax=Patella caerulea TaxID=87958 RepID=A0AAN8G526_PATCE